MALWTKQEDAFLRENVGRLPYIEIAKKLGRSHGAVIGHVGWIGIAHTEKNVQNPCAICKKLARRMNLRQFLCPVCFPQYRSIYGTVVHHYEYIFNKKNSRHLNYEGMPFFDGWKPKKGGSYKTGAMWIIKNLGFRPKGTQLHIVNHEKGFVPGNLEWTHPVKQVNQQMFKIIAQQRHRIKQLEAEVAELKKAA
jgi:hypothetical protein